MFPFKQLTFYIICIRITLSQWLSICDLYEATTSKCLASAVATDELPPFSVTHYL